MRTIVEFNHDYAHDIEKDPLTFVGLLRLALNSGDAREWHALEPFGVRRVVMAHHSDTRAVTINGREHAIP